MESIPKPAATVKKIDLEAFISWSENSDRRPITLVTVGRAKSGKSTLINTLLQLEGGAKALVGYSAKPVTTKVRKYNNERNDVSIHIIDTPDLSSLHRSEDHELQTIAEMSTITGGRADVVLFCVSVMPVVKINDTEIGVIRALTKAFGSQIWEKAILVLTFCNQVDNEELKKISTKYAAEFSGALKKAGVESISAKSVMDIEPGSSFNGIITVPAGKLQADKLAHSENWIASLYMEVLKKCDSEVVPPLLQFRGLLSPLMTTAAGGGLGATIGAGIGALVGGVVLPGVGSIPGSAFGAAVGGGGGGVATFTSMYGEISYIRAINRKVKEINLHEEREKKRQKSKAK